MKNCHLIDSVNFQTTCYFGTKEVAPEGEHPIIPLFIVKVVNLISLTPAVLALLSVIAYSNFNP